MLFVRSGKGVGGGPCGNMAMGQKRGYPPVNIPIQPQEEVLKWVVNPTHQHGIAAKTVQRPPQPHLGCVGWALGLEARPGRRPGCGIAF